jgi:glycosyltransferase involved in cell wall biosynthesis
MKIAFLLGNINGVGGIERSTYIIANALSKEGLDVIIISFFRNSSNLIQEKKDDIKNIFLFNHQLSMTKALLFKNGVGKLRKILKKEKINILVSCGVLFNPISLMAKKGTKTKVYCWEHTNPFINKDYRFQKLSRNFAKKADLSIVLTKASYEYYVNVLKIPDSRIKLIPNTVDPSIEENINYNIKSNKIISVGRLSFPKNFNAAIRIAQVVLSKCQDWKWDIYGDGEDKEKLKNEIIKANMSDKISLMGNVNDIYKRYKDYSFLVMTSRYEGFPMTLLEAAKCGLPLISFDILTGPNEIIKHGENGFLIQNMNEEEMGEKILFLIQNKERRCEMSKKAVELVEKFSLTNVIRKWKEILN